MHISYEDSNNQNGGLPESNTGCYPNPSNFILGLMSWNVLRDTRRAEVTCIGPQVYHWKVSWASDWSSQSLSLLLPLPSCPVTRCAPWGPACSNGIQPVLKIHYHVAQVVVLQQGHILATEWAADQLKTQGVHEDEKELGDKPMSHNHCLGHG